ncbi:YciI family protein [Georgenia sp. Z1344]|uniref:YciI family protein n=1 Tax=Georgenia sp. Z1344 TaxID=3416706 RepID=UPI003CF956B1
MRFALLLHNGVPDPGQVSDEDMADMQRLFGEYADALTRAGVLVGADILTAPGDARTVTRRTGETQVQDGPFAETKEALAGVFVVDVPDADAALAWAERCPASSYGTIEVRPAATSIVDGAWTA